MRGRAKGPASPNFSRVSRRGCVPFRALSSQVGANFGQLRHPAQFVSPRPLADRLGASISGVHPESQNRAASVACARLAITTQHNKTTGS